MRAVLLILTAVMASGCTAVNRTTPDTASARPALFDAHPGQALVYVVRDERFAPDQAVRVAMDGGPVSDLHVGVFRRWAVSPGMHTIRVPDSPAAAVSLRLDPGARVFLRAGVTVGAGGVGVRLRRVPPAQGLEAARSSRLLLQGS